MAGQSIERRDMMRILALAAAASAFPGFRRWTFACEHLQPENSKTNTPDSPYQPQFCSPDEYASRVPPFWPRLSPAKSSGEHFSWTLYCQNREYEAAVGLAVAMAILWLLMLWRR